MNTGCPEFTVVIPVFNRAAMIDRALASVLKQTHDDFEVVVVDDASTDATGEVVALIADDRVVYVRRPINGGNAAARNDGIRRARGQFIAFLDSDDEYDAKYLAEVRARFSSVAASTGFIWTGVRHVTDGPNAGASSREVLWNPRSEPNRYLQFLRSLKIGAGCGLTVKRHCFETVGLFDEALRAAVDTDFLIRLVSEFDYAVVEETLVTVHDHAEERVRRGSREKAFTYSRLIDKHRPALERHSDLWAKFHTKAAWLHYHAGDRERGRWFALRSLRRNPLHFKTWSILALFELLPSRGRRVHLALSRLRPRSTSFASIRPSRAELSRDER